MKKILFILALLLTFFIPTNVYAETNVPTRPNNGVYDPQHYLSQDVVDKIIQHNTNSETQIGLYIVDTLDGYPIEDVANDVARNWKIGYKDLDKGVLIVVAIKDRKFRIETSNELAVYLTDGESKTLLNSIKDYMRNEDYSSGMLYLINHIEKEITNDGYNTNNTSNTTLNSLVSKVKDNLIKLTVVTIGFVLGFELLRFGLSNFSSNSSFSTESEDSQEKLSEKYKKSKNKKRKHKKKKSKHNKDINDITTPTLLTGFGSQDYSSHSSHSSSSSSSYSSSSSWSSDSWSGGGFDGGGSSGSW